MAFTEDVFFKTDEKYQHRIRILHWKDDKYVKSEDLFLPHEFYASDIVKEIQKPNIDLSIYPCVYGNEGALKLPQYLFLDIDGCDSKKDLENFIHKVNNVLDASPFYILETSPNHFVVAYLILAMNEDLSSHRISHRIAQELLKPIMSPKLKLKLDKNSFSENFPMRFPLSYNHKRGYQTRLITFEGIRMIPKPFDPSQFDIFELLEKNEKRVRGRKRTVKIDNEEELWQYVITEILNQKWEWRQASKGQYLLLHCPFHPPDTRPSSQLIKYGDGRVLFYDFHNGTSMSLPTFLNELARNTQDPVIRGELYKVYHSIYKKQKERNELVSVSKSLLEEKEGEEPSQEDIFESLSNVIYEKLKEITKEVLIIYRDGKFTLHGKFVNINHKPYDECIITMNLEDFTKAEKFLHEYSIAVIDTHFNVIAKLFNKKLLFIKEFKKILQYGYSKYLDWLSEEFKLREQASMKRAKEEILQKLYAILSRSRDAKKYAFDSEAFIRFFNSFLKDKLKQFSLPYIVLNYDDESILMIPIEGLARVLDNYREVFYGLNLSDILSIILHPLPDEDSREPKIYKDFWLDMEWICISTSIIPQSYRHIISLDIKHKQEIDQEKFERFIECLKLNQFNESDYPPVLEALNIAYRPLNKNFFEMRINNKEHLIDLLNLALTSTFAIQIHDEPSEKFIVPILVFLGIPYDIQDNIIIVRPDLDGGSGEAVLLYHIYDFGDTAPYITIEPHEEKDPDEIGNPNEIEI